MELNPLKWFKKTPEEQEIEDSAKPAKWSIGITVDLSEADEERANLLVESWREHADVLRSSPGNSGALSEISLRQAEIRKLFDNTPAAQAEAEVLLANISVDIEASHQAGEFSEQSYQTYSALGEINVFNSILKGKTPEWMEQYKYLPTLSKMVTKRLSVRTLISSGLVYGGGIAAGALLSPWILGAVATTVGAIHGGNIARAWSRRSAEGKFDKKMADMNERIESGGIDSIPDDEIKTYAQDLLVGAHRFGKVIGINEDDEGSKFTVDLSSIPAQVLIRLDAIAREQTKEELLPEDREVIQRVEDARKFGHRDDTELEALLGEDAVELEKLFVQMVLHKKSQGTQDVFNALRKDQSKEHQHARLGAVYGMLLSTVMRAAGAMVFRGQTLQEFVQSHFSFKADAQRILDLLDLGEKGTKAAGPALEATQKFVGDAITDARLKMGTLNIPGGMKPEALPLSGGGGPPLAGTEATGGATVLQGGGISSQSLPAAAPASAGATVDTPAQPAGSGSANAELAQSASGSAYGIPGAKVEAPAPGGGGIRPEQPAVTNVPAPTESISDKMPGMPKDWAMLKFLGQQLGEEVQKNLSSGRAGSFPASERGTLLTVLYNLKEQGLIRMEGDRVVLKTDDATLGRMYQESHASPHATADSYGKKIKLEHWKEWFGGEEQRHPSVPVHEVPKGHAHGTGVKIQKGGDVIIEESQEHLNAQKGLANDATIDDADKRVLSGQKGPLTPSEADRISAELQRKDGSPFVQPTGEVTGADAPHMRDDIGTAAQRALGARFGEAHDLAAAVVQPASPSDTVIQPSVPSVAEVATVSPQVAPAASESITGAIAEQHPASVSAKVEPPIPEKITGQTVDTGGKISGTAVSGEGTGHIKAEAVAEAPKSTPALSTTELAQQAYQHMQDSLYKKYGIVPYVVDQIQGLRVSSFLERIAEVKAGKMDLRSAFSSDQFSLKEYEKLASYLTDHDPNAGEKRMLLKNYLLSKEK